MKIEIPVCDVRDKANQGINNFQNINKTANNKNKNISDINKEKKDNPSANENMEKMERKIYNYEDSNISNPNNPVSNQQNFIREKSHKDEEDNNRRNNTENQNNLQVDSHVYVRHERKKARMHGIMVPITLKKTKTTRRKQITKTTGTMKKGEKWIYYDYLPKHEHAKQKLF